MVVKRYIIKIPDIKKAVSNTTWPRFIFLNFKCRLTKWLDFTLSNSAVEPNNKMPVSDIQIPNGSSSEE